MSISMMDRSPRLESAKTLDRPHCQNNGFENTKPRGSTANFFKIHQNRGFNRFNRLSTISTRVEIDQKKSRLLAFWVPISLMQSLIWIFSRWQPRLLRPTWEIIRAKFTG